MNFFRKKSDKVADAPDEDATRNSEKAAAAKKKDPSEEDDDGEEEESMSDVPLDSTHKEDSPVFPPTPIPKNDEEEREKKEDSDSDGDEYTDDDDDDSEYTYETDDDDGEDPSGKKGGWFGFLRRGTKTRGHDGEDDDDDDDDDDAEDDDSEEEKGDDHDDDGNGEGDELSSSNDSSAAVVVAAAAHPLLNSPVASPTAASSSNAVSAVRAEKENQEEQEEAILMAQAIRRVQDRIQSNGGNPYDALSERDRKLVDALKGVDDDDAVREAVVKSAEEEEEESRIAAKRGAAGGEDVAVEAQTIEAVDDGVSNLARLNGLLEEPKENRPSTPPSDRGAIVDGQVDRSGKQPVEEADGGVDGKVDQAGELPVEEANDDDERRLTEDKEPVEQAAIADEDDDEEHPTDEERRSLISLAAEHDRVDVLRELLDNAGQSSSLSRDALLLGLPPPNGWDTSYSFAPPPLHVAVAHGSANVASCLLRMGADPSVRPEVPPAYMTGAGVAPVGGGGSKGGEEDRNYKKYHGTTAWELAFGGVVVLEDDDVDTEEESEEEGERSKGWFGFGGSPKKKEEKDEPSSSNPEETPPGRRRRRIKKKLPLNIPPRKLEGIKHAFTAEALRAIGSDEAGRLAQLLDAGMGADTEVGGKSLAGWAEDMDAADCREVLSLRSEEGEEGGGLPEREADAEVPTETVGAEDEEEPRTDDNSALQTEHDGQNGETTAEDHSPPPIPRDPRLAGLSPSDIRSLALENETLLPQLAACRDDLAHEAAVSQGILRDVHATGGKGGLSSASLLDLVRALKDRRAAAEEAAVAWRKAWEEREDELDFFWEEVLDEGWRAALGQVLVGAEEEVQGVVPGGGDPRNGDGAEDWSRRFAEADARVAALRASIADLAEESARYAEEIKRNGMSGALSLTRSLREEVKEFEKEMNTSMRGEAVCRRKLEIIQFRLGQGNVADDGGGSLQQQQQGDHADETARGEDDGMEDFQLQAIVKQQQQQPLEQELDKEKSRVPSPLFTAVRPQPPVQEKDELVDQENDSMTPRTQDQTAVQQPPGGAVSLIDEHTEEDSSLGETNDILEEEEDDDVAILQMTESAKEEEISSGLLVSNNSSAVLESPAVVCSPRSENGSGAVSNSNAADSDSETDAGQRATYEDEHHDAANEARPSPKLPSEEIAEGTSTAIVVHSPNGGRGADSIPSQIWEILRRIVGLGRVPAVTAHSESYHDAAENHSHIMVV